MCLSVQHHPPATTLLNYLCADSAGTMPRRQASLSGAPIDLLRFCHSPSFTDRPVPFHFFLVTTTYTCYLCARSDCSNERLLVANGNAKARSCTKFYSWCQLSHVTGALAFSATNMASISRSVRRKQAEDSKCVGRVNPRRNITMLLIEICNE